MPWLTSMINRVPLTQVQLTQQIKDLIWILSDYFYEDLEQTSIKVSDARKNKGYWEKSGHSLHQAAGDCPLVSQSLWNKDLMENVQAMTCHGKITRKLPWDNIVENFNQIIAEVSSPCSICQIHNLGKTLE